MLVKRVKAKGVLIQQNHPLDNIKDISAANYSI